MPKKLEAKLKRAATRKGFTGKRADRYVYGALQRLTSWKPSGKRAG